MDLALAFVVFAGTMIASLTCGFSMLWALIVGFVGFMGVGVRRGFALPSLFRMSWDGVRASFIVIRVMLTIGVLTGLWRSAGTFAILTAWGLQLITPSMFLLAAFLLSCTLSYAIGTSFGTAGTMGVALMTLARSGGVNELAAAGAILSGIYFGDRASPASSCANLVAALSGTELYGNVRLMMRTALLPLMLALGFYLALSWNHPMLGAENPALTAMNLDFTMSPWAVLPAVLMLVLPLFGVKIFHTFWASIACAFLCTLFLQGQSLGETLRCALTGLHAPEGSARAPFNGGGLSSMIGISSVLAVSGTYSEIFRGTGMIGGLQAAVSGLMERWGVFPVTLATGTVANAVFCSQAVGIMMTTHVVRQPYERRGLSGTELAQDIANSTVVTAGLIPWCIGCSVPLTMLGVSAHALPYAVYLWLLPVCYAFTRRRWFKNGGGSGAVPRRVLQ